ncbi:MAG: sulfite exporter TauE/SafE family protein [Candidatus Dojkabacteria bacterium]|nr:MAG: sulfite exporter TauE/SafE family protein [Candidatus Dojkabacteria bacterium]
MTLHVSGTHCASCQIYIEETLNKEEYISEVHVDLERKLVHIKTEGSHFPEDVVTRLTRTIQSHGYALSLTKQAEVTYNKDELWKALPIGVGVLVLFYLLQSSGILNFGIGGTITPVTSFIVGLVASVSSCLAVVGGLVLSLSAKISQDSRSDTKTFVLFHAGRILSFAVLGGALGALGNVIGINFTITTILGLVAAVIMLLLGLNLVGLFEKNKITLPSGIFTTLRRVEHKNFAPLLLGFATFFLPCGFTQSMQVSALGSGNFLSGALILLSFALGTLPVLALLSFGSATFATSKYAPLFFKSTGIIVIGFGLFALLSGLASLGIIPPLLNI